MKYYPFIRDWLFKIEPEKAHALTLNTLKFLKKYKILWKKEFYSPARIMGIDFPNPVGLAAGFDKNGDYIEALAALGFGFIEIGTVTPRSQPGNSMPRLFRLPEAEALINRLGFNNKGVHYLVNQIKNIRYQGVLGVNIGKNFDTPLEKALDDYMYCFSKVYPYANYIVVNISSPNTPELRLLQFGENLRKLLKHLKKEQKWLAIQQGKYVPFLIKISPDLSNEELEQITKQLLRYEVDGVIATNTTVSRKNIGNIPHANEEGGLSGKPLLTDSTNVVNYLHQLLSNKIPIIAVGGIMSAADAQKKFVAGASLVQIYTGFIYQGPQLVSDIAYSYKRKFK